MEVGPLGSTGVTRLHGYYGPVRIPADQRRGYVFPRRIRSRTRPAGPPRFRRHPSSPAVRRDPGEPNRCSCRRLPCSCWLPHVREAGHSQVVSNEASTVHCSLWLTTTLAEAPHPPSLERTLGSLHVSSTFHMVSSLHLTGWRRLRLARRTRTFLAPGGVCFECAFPVSGREPIHRS